MPSPNEVTVESNGEPIQEEHPMLNGHALTVQDLFSTLRDSKSDIQRESVSGGMVSCGQMCKRLTSRLETFNARLSENGESEA